MMTLERAREIVKAVNARCFVTMGLERDLPSLEGISLGEMVEATAMVRNANKAAESLAKLSGGTYSISMVPDDRLIAAAYAIDHFPISDEPILALPLGVRHLRVLVAAQIPTEQLEIAE